MDTESKLILFKMAKSDKESLMSLKEDDSPLWRGAVIGGYNKTTLLIMQLGIWNEYLEWSKQKEGR